MTKNNSISNLKKALKYAKRQKKYFIFYFIANIFIAIFGAIVPLLGAKQLLSITNNMLHQLLIISLIIFIIEITNNFCHYISRKNSQIFSREILCQLQIDTAKEIMNIETADLDKNSSGVFIERLIKDTSRISDIFLQLNMSITDIITNIGILFAIFVINKTLFIYYLISIIIIFLLEKKRIQVFNELDKKYRKKAEKATGLVSELVRGVRDIKVLNATDSFLNITSQKITELNQERYKMSKSNRIWLIIINSFRDLLNLLLIILFIFMIKHKTISIANAIIIYMYRDRVFNLLTLASAMMEWFKDFNLSASRVFEIIESPKFTKESFGKQHIKNIKGDFEFKNVTFSYDNKKDVLKNLSFKIKHNQTVSFVGKSGAGKTTIFSLLAKLYNVDDNHIFIDGIDINKLDCDSIRGNISIITQSPYIFNMSIKENLTVIKDGLTDEEIIKACQLACLHDFIMTLPNGYDTIVGEGGLTLSGGQRQRLAIARALVQKTKIILFDEATSALDNETQRSIQNAINNMRNDYTILIIAHRLSTVINSDKIMLIDNGQITASGTHQELLKNNKKYQELYNIELKKN